MHSQKYFALKFWGIISILFVVFIAVLIQLEGGKVNSSKNFLDISQTISDKNECESSIDDKRCTQIYLQVFSVDAEKQYLNGSLLITPPTEYGIEFANSTQVTKTTDIYLDAARIDTGGINQDLLFTPPDYIRTIFFSMDLSNVEYNDLNFLKARSSDVFYPFDRYSGLISGSVYFFPDEESETEESVVAPILVKNYSGSVPGWNIELDYSYQRTDLSDSPNLTINNMEDGFFLNVFRVERSDLTKVIAGIFSLLFLGGAISLLVLLKSILYSHKRPTLTALVWAGSTTFTLIQIRSLLPGNPQPGVYFDLFIFYPSIIACFASSLLILKLWIKDLREAD